MADDTAVICVGIPCATNDIAVFQHVKQLCLEFFTNVP